MSSNLDNGIEKGIIEIFFVVHACLLPHLHGEMLSYTSIPSFMNTLSFSKFTLFRTSVQLTKTTWFFYGIGVSILSAPWYIGEISELTGFVRFEFNAMWTMQEYFLYEIQGDLIWFWVCQVWSPCGWCKKKLHMKVEVTPPGLGVLQCSIR